MRRNGEIDKAVPSRRRARGRDGAEPGEPSGGADGKQGETTAVTAKKGAHTGSAVNKDSPSDSGDGTVSVQIADIPIVTSKRWYLTLSAAIGVIGSIISATYFVVDYGRIKPIEKDFEESRTLLSVARSDAVNAKAQLERAEQRIAELAAKFDRPAQIFPRDRSSVVGANVSFLWDYVKHDSNTQYILELQDMAGRAPPVKINVDRPETKSMFYAFDAAAAGSYVWRVRPGRVTSEEEVGQGPWSPAAVFTIFPTVAERIKATGKLRVASTPTSYDAGINNKAGYDGVEIKILRWLMPRIADKLKLIRTPNLEVEEIPWSQLFIYMQNGEADIALRSITRSVQRENDYQNLKFTSGYAINHQIFVQLTKDGTFPNSLKGRIVGAKSRSINEAAARFLSQRFGYSVNSSYTAYGDVLEGLRRGEIAFALVDNSLVDGLLGKRVFALGGVLDNELRQFYKRELGFDHEEYAILVYEGASSELRTALNEILSSDDYRKFAASLKIELPRPH